MTSDQNLPVHHPPFLRSLGYSSPCWLDPLFCVGKKNQTCKFNPDFVQYIHMFAIHMFAIRMFVVKIVAKSSRLFETIS